MDGTQNIWWTELSKKEKYFQKRIDNFKSEIHHFKELGRNGDISLEESKREVAKLEKRLSKNYKTYREYLDTHKT